MIERFTEQERNGIYFKVVKEGFLQAGDAIKLVEESSYQVTVQDYVQCYYYKGSNKEVLDILLSIPFLPERHKVIFDSFKTAGAIS